jgi:hypothetical protein
LSNLVRLKIVGVKAFFGVLHTQHFLVHFWDHFINQMITKLNKILIHKPSLPFIYDEDRLGQIVDKLRGFNLRVNTKFHILNYFIADIVSRSHGMIDNQKNKILDLVIKGKVFLNKDISIRPNVPHDNGDDTQRTIESSNYGR